MLGKLIKRDLRSCGPLLGILFAVALSVAVCARVSYAVLGTDFEASYFLFGIDTVLSGGSDFFYTMTHVATVVFSSGVFIMIELLPFAVTVVLLWHFYRSMFSREGYLTHTLPVESSSIFLSKVISGVIWIIVCALVMLTMLLIIFSGSFNLYDLQCVAKELFSIDPAYIPSIIPVLPILAISPLCSLLFFYACFCLGQLFKKHRVLAAIIIYAGINIVLSFLSIPGIGLFVVLASGANDAASFFAASTWGFFLLEALCTVALYLLCRYIIGKRLNLE